MNIFIFCGPLAFGKGGMEKVATNLANFLAESGFNVYIGYFVRQGQANPSYPLNEKVEKVAWNQEHHKIVDYKKRILQCSPDVFMIFGASSQIITISSLVYGTGIPLIIHEGSNHERIITQNWAIPRKISESEAKWEREVILSTASRIRMTLEAHKESLPNILKAQVRAFPNAFKAQPQSQDKYVKNASRFRIINIGGLKPNKNILPLIDAFLNISHNYPNWELVVFSAIYKNKRGERYVRQIKDHVSSKKAEDIIKFFPETDDIDQEYALSDIHAITSTSEGFGNCVAEAMTHGLPNIGLACCPGVKDLIDHEVDGLLVSCDSDIVLGLENALKTLMDSAELRKRYGNAGRKKAQEFNPELINQKWLDIIYEAYSYKNSDKLFAEQLAFDKELAKKYKRGAYDLFKSVLGDTFDELLEVGKLASVDYKQNFPSSEGYKITIFTSGDLFKIGGVQRSYVFLTQHLVDVGHHVTLVGWRKSSGNECNSELAYPIDERICLKFIPQTMTKNNFDDVCSLISDLKPDLVLIVNSTRFSVFLACVCLKVGVPFVQSIRGSSEYCLKYLWPTIHSINSVFLTAKAGHILMPSYKQIFPSSVQEKLEAIPSQIEPATSFGSPDKSNNAGRFTILYSGRFSFEKRLDLLVNAFAILKDDFPKWDLWLYGMGPLLEKLQALVKELNLEDRVTFGEVRNTDEMYQIYPKVHLKVLPSEQEGCPMALREAMAHAIPVIAYDECSGSNEIITHGEDGLLIASSQDRISSLAEGMRYLMERPELRRTMGLKARDIAAKYHPDAINKKWENLLVSAIQGTGKASSTIRDKYREEHECAEEILKTAANLGKFQDFCLFDRDPDLFKKYENQYLMIYAHRLFDKLFYLQEYMDVKKSGKDPLLHYISVGWKLGYNPSAEFDTNAYIASYMKPNEEICPLYHFYTKGRFEGVQPITPKTDYYEKWPQRKPKRPYTFEEDAAFEIIFFNQHFNQHKDL